MIASLRKILAAAIAATVGYLTSRSFILSSLALGIIWLIVSAAPNKPVAQSIPQVVMQYDHSSNSIRFFSRETDLESEQNPLSLEEANLLQQQRIAYFALWSVVLVPLSLLFAAISILNQQHNTEKSLDAMIRADRPWLDFEFELINEWRPTTVETGPAILSDCNLSYINHGKHPAVRVKFDFSCLVGADEIESILNRYNLRSQHTDYGGPNVVMPNSTGRTFVTLTLPDPNQTDGSEVYIVVTCYYFDPRSRSEERKTVKAYHLRTGQNQTIELGSMIELQQVT